MSSRGRGGRFKNYRRDENTARREPHGDNVNEFFLEPERGAQKRDNDTQKVRLQVSNISNMTESSLRQLFSEFGEPTVFIDLSHRNNTKTKRSALVNFNTAYEAHNAMSSLNKAAPHYLQISLTRTFDDNELEDFKREIQPCNTTENVRGKGRGIQIPIFGKPPKSYQTIKPLMESYSCKEDVSENHEYSNSKFQHDGTPSNVEDTNAVYGSMTKISQGKRYVSMGRGVNKDDNVEKYVLPKISSKVHEEIGFMNNAILKPSKEDLRCYPPDVNYPFETGKCPNCNRSSTFICCNCKNWYCSMECVREHNVKYGTRCGGQKLTNAEEQAYNDNDCLINKKHYKQRSFSPETKDIDGTHLQKNRPSNNNVLHCVKGEEDYVDSSPKGRKEVGGGNRDSHQQSGQRLKRVSENSEHNETYSNSNQIGKSGQNRRSLGNNGDNQAGRGNNRSGSRNSFNSRSRLDQRLFNNRNSQHDKDVYIRKDSKTQVVISSVTNENNVYWVFKKSSLKDMEYILAATKRVTTAKAVDSPSKDMICAAPFFKEWYRAKILRCLQDSALVRFIDFGNEDKISFNELKALPKDLETKQPLAFKIHIKGATEKFTENEEITIKFINMHDSDEWNVNLVENDTECSSRSYNSDDGEPGISFDHYDLVYLMSGSNGEFYVQLSYNIVKLKAMNENLGKHSSEKVKPQVGELYVRCYGKTWCRALVVKERPLTVHYIDFGNLEEVKSEDLHPLPEEYKDVPALAIKIKLKDGTPSKFMKIKISSESTLRVKAIAKLKDGTWLVSVKREETTESDINEKIHPKSDYADQKKNVKHGIELVNDGDEDLSICVRKSLSKEYLCGSLIMNKERCLEYFTVVEISQLLKTTESSHNYKFNVSDLVIARVGTTWCRGYIMQKTDEECSVALIDLAKVVTVKENYIKLLPTKFHTSPVRLAVRILLDTPLDCPSDMLGNTIKLTKIKKTGDIIKCTFGAYGEAVLSIWTPLIEEAGLRVFPLKSNSLVVISSFHTPRSIYLRSAAKEDMIKLSELLQDIVTYSTRGEILNRKPLGGEMVCAKYSEDGNYYRGQIFQKGEEDAYKVNFVDFGNTEFVSATDMMPLPDTFKKVPCHAVKVGLKDLTAHAFNPQAMLYLNELTLSEAVLHLTYNDNLGEVTLAQQNGQVINTRLAELMEHSLKTLKLPQSDHVERLHPFMGQDVMYENWPVRSRINISVITVENCRTFLAVDLSSKLINHIVRFLTPDINKYCLESPQKTYNPRTNEMILAKYKDDGEDTPSWYRAVCIKAMVSSSFILFIDYGNCGEVAHSNIRSMPAEFMDTPAALKRCTVYGISDSLNDQMKDNVKDLLADFKGEAVVVEDHENGNATLWIPSLYAKLKTIGHPEVDSPVN